MLKVFKRKQKPHSDPTKRSFLYELSWPLKTKLFFKINPFAGRFFFHEIICMVAKMAAVDGPVNEIELFVFTELLEREFALGRRQLKRARNILFEAHRSTKSFEDFAREFYKYFRKQPAVLENALDVLLAMAYSDNRFAVGEQKLMAQAAEIFHVKAEVLDRLIQHYHRSTSVIEKPQAEKKVKYWDYAKSEHKFEKSHDDQKSGENASHQNSSHGRTSDRASQGRSSKEQSHSQSQTAFRRTWFEVLECTPFDSESIVKRHYRSLVQKYHPDKLPAGIPEVMKRASTERFIEIQNAYEDYLAQAN